LLINGGDWIILMNQDHHLVEEVYDVLSKVEEPKIATIEELASAGISLAHVEIAEDLAILCAQKLDAVYENLSDQTLPSEKLLDEITSLFSFLDQIRRKCAKADWDTLKAHVILPHKIRELIHRDPCTYRSFSKPRGYAGDAVLMDFFYRDLDSDFSAESLERKLFNVVTNRPAGVALRDRLAVVAKGIDRTANRKKKIRILSIASGHLRELDLLESSPDSIFEFFALDQDKESLEILSTSNFANVIKPINTSFISLIKKENPLQLGKFDYVYAAGLFDYLSARTSKLLVQYMFEVLNPGGTMLVANFMPNIEDIGYMETFMAWELIYRTLPDFEAMSNGLPFEEIQEKRIFQGKNRNVVYLEIEKIAE